ncbi:ABC transporter substrate-binding protein [Bifidobacterium italicum]|uniref:ABC transporter substrate-binding protein n=1 Tax=Bifidobacterium italicum TaxID=1960968 RepID=A0A2A2EL43_9BIFI|nr:ABC transporter substrate-binding protein [Bifidobacterium italicum]PAU69763.1 ABC transporter substrate-binding protein [Bifidobacterium italicum]
MHTRESRGARVAPWIVFAAIIAVAAIVAAFLFMRGRDGGAPWGGGGSSELTVGLTDQPTSLDIRTNDERGVEQALVGNVYETLLTRGDDASVAANLVARWVPSADGLHYSFILRDGLTFADGSALDASAVVASLQRTITDRHVGYEELGDVATVRNTSDSQFTIDLHRPNPRLLWALTGRAGIVVNVAAAERAGDDYARRTYGSGPFDVAGSDGSSITLTRNDRYWGRKASTSRIRLAYYKDEAALADAAEAGSLDVALPRDAATTQRLAKHDGLRVDDGLGMRQTMLALNNAQESPFSDVQVRQLTRYAIDAAGIAKTQPESAAQLSGPIGRLQPGYVDLDDLFPYDEAKAASMRAYFPYVYFHEFTVLTDETHRAVAERITATFNDVLSMPATLEVVDADELAKRVSDGDYDCALVTLEGVDDYRRFVDGSPMFHYQNGEAQRVYEDALARTDYKDYRERMRDFDRIVSQDAASAWLYENKDFVVAKSSVDGVDAENSSWRLRLADLATRR